VGGYGRAPDRNQRMTFAAGIVATHLAGMDLFESDEGLTRRSLGVVFRQLLGNDVERDETM